MAGTSAQLRRLGAELRRRRLAANMTQVQVAAALGRSHVAVVSWERGKTRISKSDLAYLLAELKVPVEVRKDLERLRADSGTRRGWWSEYELGSWLRPLVSFEQDAARITSFEPIVISGLLQTREYAHAVHLGTPFNVPASEVDRWVEARMQRQNRLTGEAPLSLHTVISEAALRLEVGSPTVMAQQLAHLLEVGTLPTIKVQVLESKTGAHSGISGGWCVLHFEDSKIDPPLAYADGPLGGYMIDDAGDVATLISMFGDIQRLALTEKASRTLINTVMKEYEKRAT